MHRTLKFTYRFTNVYAIHGHPRPQWRYKSAVRAVQGGGGENIGDEEAPPLLNSDWRSFRARLVEQSRSGESCTWRPMQAVTRSLQSLEAHRSWPLIVPAQTPDDDHLSDLSPFMRIQVLRWREWKVPRGSMAPPTSVPPRSARIT